MAIPNRTFRGRSWQATVKEQRYASMRLLQKTQAFQSKWDETLKDAYRWASCWPVRETI